MPHFTDDGRDTVLCQVCARVVTAATWRPDITGNKSAGNVCKSCEAKAQAHNRTQQPASGWESLAEHCAKESGFPLGSLQLRDYINRYYGHG